MFDVIGKRNWFFLFSGLLVVPGLIFILLGPITNGKAGLKFSIDYTGGTLIEVKFKDTSVKPADVLAVLAAQGLPDSTVVNKGNGFLSIRTKPLDLNLAPQSTPTPSPSASASGSPSASGSASPGASGSASPAASASASPSAKPSASPSAGASASPSGSPSPSGSASPSSSAGAVASPSASVAPTPSPTPKVATLPTTGKIGTLSKALVARFGPIDQVGNVTTIGPVISSELTGQAILLVILGSIGILAWLTLRFRDVKFGVTAIAALIHDVIVVVGFFAVVGTFFGVEVDALFVTAMLTVIGFSVHDTIVVFDRIRENKARHAGEPFDQIVNHSILQTFGRSVNTSFTVIVTLLALLLMGGSAITYFVLALLIGITSGTYSSIFNASPLLVVWQLRDDRRKAKLLAGRPRRASA